jgi:hypothetical protein
MTLSEAYQKGYNCGLEERREDAYRFWHSHDETLQEFWRGYWEGIRICDLA